MTHKKAETAKIVIKPTKPFWDFIKKVPGIKFETLGPLISVQHEESGQNFVAEVFFEEAS